MFRFRSYFITFKIQINRRKGGKRPFSAWWLLMLNWNSSWLKWSSKYYLEENIPKSIALSPKLVNHVGTHWSNEDKNEMQKWRNSESTRSHSLGTQQPKICPHSNPELSHETRTTLKYWLGNFHALPAFGVLSSCHSCTPSHNLRTSPSLWVYYEILHIPHDRPRSVYLNPFSQQLLQNPHWDREGTIRAWCGSSHACCRW